MFLKKHFFTEAERKKIVQAITGAEEMTSGEIRLHVEAKCKKENVLERATEVFFHLARMPGRKTIHSFLKWSGERCRRGHPGPEPRPIH